MIGTTLRQVIDDPLTALKQKFDDIQITEAQMAYWAIIIGNRLRAQHIQKRDSGAFLSTFILPVQEYSANENPNKVKGRKFILLPQAIYDFNEDAGISFIAFYDNTAKPGERPEFTRRTFTRTTQAKAETLYLSKYEKPEANNMYFYRVGDHIYFLGAECINMEEVEMGLFTSIPPVTHIDIDAPFDFPEELIAILQRQLLDLGRFALLLPEERINDGKSDNGQNRVPTNKITSVNDLSDNTER